MVALGLLAQAGWPRLDGLALLAVGLVCWLWLVGTVWLAKVGWPWFVNIVRLAHDGWHSWLAIVG